MGVLVQRGVMKRSEARAELGLPATRSDDVYLMPRNLAELSPSGRGESWPCRTAGRNGRVGTSRLRPLRE